jgi:hypothetical protein
MPPETPGSPHPRCLKTVGDTLSAQEIVWKQIHCGTRQCLYSALLECSFQKRQQESELLVRSPVLLNRRNVEAREEFCFIVFPNEIFERHDL